MSACGVTFSSGVHVGQRDDGLPWEDWFNAVPTTQFSSFTLVGTPRGPGGKVGGTRLSGHAGLRDRPVVFEFQRLTRDVLTDSLAALHAEGLKNGRPSTTLSGFRDAVARSGFLCNVSWTERRNSGGAQAFSVWGVVLVEEATVTGVTELLQVTLWPCDLLNWGGTGTFFLSPPAFDALIAGS